MTRKDDNDEAACECGARAGRAHLAGRQLALVHHGAGGQGAEVDVVVGQVDFAQRSLAVLAQKVQLRAAVAEAALVKAAMCCTASPRGRRQEGGGAQRILTPCTVEAKECRRQEA